MITQKKVPAEETKDEYVGAPKPFKVRITYDYDEGEDYEDGEDYADNVDYEETDDFDVLTEWNTLPDKVWTPYMQKEPKPVTPTGWYGN